MNYDELHQLYGHHVANRVRQELTPAEFTQASAIHLMDYLDARAQTAHKAYRHEQEQPALQRKDEAHHAEALEKLYHKWCAADDLAYLISIAEDVSTHTIALRA